MIYKYLAIFPTSHRNNCKLIIKLLRKEWTIMPITFTGDYVCEKCGEEFEWNYFELIQQNIDSLQFNDECILYKKTLVHSCHEKSCDIYDVEMNCTFCGFDNHFSYKLREEG